MTHLSTLPTFPILNQKGCDLSVAIGICRDQSSYSQLWIVSVFPWISLDHLSCLVCKWVQVLSLVHRAKTSSCSCTLFQPSPRTHRLPWHWPSAPSWQSLFRFGNSAASEIQIISDDPAHLFMWGSSPFVQPQSRRETPDRTTEGELHWCCAMTVFEEGHLWFLKAS